jgi:hypothetical protein
MTKAGLKVNKMSEQAKKTTMRLQPDAVDKLREAETLCSKKRGVRPDHSEALRLASAAWIRELKAA